MGLPLQPFSRLWPHADERWRCSHEWMFVTDTVDAMYPPDPWLPQAIMDRLGEILGDPRNGSTSLATVTATLEPSRVDIDGTQSAAASGGALDAPGPPARRPLLPTRRVKSIRDLEPFFATVSVSAYESVYRAGSRVDWAAVERSLERDVFEGGGSGISGGTGPAAAP